MCVNRMLDYTMLLRSVGRGYTIVHTLYTILLYRDTILERDTRERGILERDTILLYYYYGRNL